MSEPLSTNEIEDVVSSVRRLVSPEARPRPMSRDLGLDRLILTPQLRIVAEQPASGPTIVKLETVSKKTRSRTRKSKPLTGLEGAASGPVVEAPAFVAPVPSLAEMALAAEDAVVLAAEPVAEAVADVTPDQPVVAKGKARKSARPVAGDAELAPVVAVPEPAAVPASKAARRKLGHTAEAAKSETVVLPKDEATASPAAKTRKSRSQGAKAAEPVAEAVPAPSVTKTARRRKSEITPLVVVAEAAAPAPLVPGDAGPALTADPSPAEPLSVVSLPEVAPLQDLSPGPAVEPALSEAAHDSRPTPVEPEAPEEFALQMLTDPEGNPISLLDEEALILLLRRVIREELQGALGEKITRNVRKLVRAEINRALTAQTLD